MSSWVVVPCLLALRGEFNKLSPNRDKGADGTIGDSSHTSTSDHSADEDSDALRGKDADSTNEVHALDIDSSGPWPDGRRGDIAGSWFDTKVKQVIAEEKRRWLNPNDMCRLNYVIWRGHIYDKDADFAPKAYTGSDPHTNHAHFSARYETRAENDTRPWGIWEDIMAKLDDDDRKWLTDLVAPLKSTDYTVNPIARISIPDYSQPAADRRMLAWSTWVGYTDGNRTADRAALVARLDQLSAQLAAFVSAEATDDATRAAAQAQMQQALDGLAATVVSQVVAALPEGSDQISQEEVTTAVTAAFRSAFTA